jgi:hypothetical protein
MKMKNKIVSEEDDMKLNNNALLLPNFAVLVKITTKYVTNNNKICYK